jgi:hypothetical protein
LSVQSIKLADGNEKMVLKIPDKLQDVISPDEKVLFMSKQKGSFFKLDLTKRLMPDTLIVTDKRVAYCAPKGLIRGALGMSDFLDVTYTEISNISIDRGAFRSTLKIVQRMGGTTQIKDIPKDDASQAFQIIRSRLSEIQFAQPSHTTVVNVGNVGSAKETIKETITKEVVMVSCQYCNALTPQTFVFCPNCGAKRT